ncbi:MAG: response regulator [Deltaproteobacteria bacterium]|nr:response regulator [Deltaproteobacteria bacterium]
MRIMTVDDSKATRLFIKSAIDVLGFKFLEAADGREGLDLLKKENGNVDLILLDWNMPVMDGMEMLKRLQADQLLNAIPVTVVTTEHERDKIAEAIDRGAKNYLIKPFSQEDLIGKIMESLGMGL